MSRNERPDQWQPFPELVAGSVEGEGGGWQIVDTAGDPSLPSGFVLLRERILGAPLHAGGRCIARHELGHVAFSPPDPPRRYGQSGIAQAVEDARVNLGLEAIGLPLVLGSAVGREVLGLARADLSRGDLGHFAARCFASLGTSLEPPLRVLAEEGPPAQRRIAALMAVARARLEGARPPDEAAAPFRSGLALARWLRRELRRLGVADITPTRLVFAACCSHGGAGGPGAKLAQALRARGLVRPGRLRVTTPPLLGRCAPDGLRRRRWRAADEGTELRHFHRLAVDQRVFGRRLRRGAGGGSVLVDVSGSMGLGAGDVDRIIAAAPGATLVALYSGRKDEGELRIVVQDGRRAGPEHLRPPGHGNVVDVPALAWLARQRPPRVWISDGHVTGVDDTPSRALHDECRRICRDARIERVRDAAEAAAILARRGGMTSLMPPG